MAYTVEYPAVVKIVFENQEAYESDRAAGIHLTVPVGDKGLYGKCVFHSGQNENRDRCPIEQPFPVPVSFVNQLRYLELTDRFPDNRPSIAPSPGPAKSLPREQATPSLPSATQRLRQTRGSIPR